MAMDDTSRYYRCRFVVDCTETHPRSPQKNTRSTNHREHELSIFCVSCVLLRQTHVRTQYNEMTAILQVLDLLDPGGCTATIDAVGGQSKIRVTDRDATCWRESQSTHVGCRCTGAPRRCAGGSTAGIWDDQRDRDHERPRADRNPHRVYHQRPRGNRVAEPRRPPARSGECRAGGSAAYCRWPRDHRIALLPAGSGTSTTCDQCAGAWALGHRKSGALGARCHLSRGCQSHSDGRCAAAYGRRAAYRAQSLAPGVEQRQREDQKLACRAQ